MVLPCYRGARLARQSVATLRDFLPHHFSTWEVIVVDDGGGDFGGDLGSLDAESVRLVTFSRNRGKGAAVRAGMRQARGHVRLYTDVDMPFGTDIIPLSAAFITQRGFHAVVGDRTLPQSRYELNVGWPRRLASGVFSRFVASLLMGGFVDTQCGFKAFRGDVAESLFAIARIDRFAFDVELLYLTLCHRLDVKKIPVQLHNNETSAVHLVRDSLRMVADVVRLRMRVARGAYSSSELGAVVARDYDEFRQQVSGRPAPTDTDAPDRGRTRTL